MAKDEDKTDKELDAMARSWAANENVCREWYTNDQGKRVRCTRKKHRFGKHK